MTAFEWFAAAGMPLIIVVFAFGYSHFWSF